MKATIKINNEAARSELEEVAGKIELVDQSLRESFSGFDVRSILPEVQRPEHVVDVALELGNLRAHEPAQLVDVADPVEKAQERAQPRTFVDDGAG
jgi:hypothetical protein